MKKYIGLLFSSFCCIMGYRSAHDSYNWRLFFIVLYVSGLVYFVAKNFVWNDKNN